MPERTATVEFAGADKRYEVQDITCFGATITEAERDAVRTAARYVRDEGHRETLHLVSVSTSPL